MRKGFVFVGVAVAVALIAGLAWSLVRTQAQARESLRTGLERRAALTARLIGGAFLASNTPQRARKQFGGSRRALGRRVAAVGRSGNDARVMVLDADGRVLAAGPREASRGDDMLARHPDRPAALGGRPALSDAFRDRGSRWRFEIAVPFETRFGRRVLVSSGPVQIVRAFTDGFFASASATAGARGYLIDGAGHTLSASGPGAGTGPDARLTVALARAPHGSSGERTFVSARVPASRWRVVLTVPSRRLYASVDGAPSRAAWQLFAAFTAAICALLGLGVAAARGARRLATAAERERAALQLAHERLHDALTGLPNRSLFCDRAEHALARARRRGRSVAVIVMDVDHLKRINDSLGHDAGDTVLREIARRLAAGLRGGDTVSRFGGDSFAVLCEDLDPDAVADVAARLARTVKPPIRLGARRLTVTVSAGIAIHGAGDTRSAGDLVRDADTATYRAKDLGRDRVEVFDSELHERAVARLDGEVALRHAIEHDEFVVHYQPIVALPDGALHGAEALVRWHRPDTDKLIAPGAFIALAEETGLIADIGARVLRTAIADIGGLARRGLIDADFELSVNLSGRQLADPGLAATVADALTGWDRPADRLCLEITETAVTSDPAAAERTLAQLAALGVRLAIDDFGVGHSSLGQLARSLPISVLKLDRSFVAAMTTPRDRGIVEAAAALANALNLASVAEGVESSDQAAELAALGFPYAQGYHFGRPMDCATFAALFNTAALTA